jgi:2-haloacid dehalogenase
MPNTLVFDVNETLLDLAALEPLFGRVFNDAKIRHPWFRQVLECALVGEVTNEYRNFGLYGIAALEMQAQIRGVSINENDKLELRETMRRLPPHPEVPEALERLRTAGFKMVALTNNVLEVVELQLTNAGIRGLFDHVLSVGAVQHLKPHPAVYEYAARTLETPINELRMIAAHDWDIRGAMRAGMRGAFVARDGLAWNPLFERPDVWGTGLLEVAAQIMR